jgi:putative membrane protein
MAGALGRATPGPRRGVNEPLSTKQLETQVLSKIHHANLAEIQQGDLAKSKGDAEAVRKFGALLSREHSKADRDLMAVVRKDGVELTGPVPVSAEEAHQLSDEKAQLERLKTLSGSAFDMELVKDMKSSHDDLIESLSSAEEPLQGTEAAKYIHQLLPKLRKHELMAARLVSHPTGE